MVAASGGAYGIRDEGLLESALARPLNRFLYEDCRDLIELAATTAVAISGNHPLIDGNKRMAFVALGQFLADNGLEFVAMDDDATGTTLSLAAGGLDLPPLVIWLRRAVREACS